LRSQLKVDGRINEKQLMEKLQQKIYHDQRDRAKELLMFTAEQKIFSSSRFPGSPEWTPMSLVLSEILRATSHQPVSLDSVLVETPSGSGKDVHELQRFATVETKLSGAEMEGFLSLQQLLTGDGQVKRNTDAAPEVGLGDVPDDLESIAGLLLFNTSDNPYRRYAMSNPLVSRQSRKVEDTAAREDKLADAPASIVHGNDLDISDKEGTFAYTPGMGSVPEFDVPAALPNLPGIATNLSLTLEDEAGIAPSLPDSLKAMLPDFPAFPSPEPVIGLREPSSPSSVVTTAATPPSSTTSSSAWVVSPPSAESSVQNVPQGVIPPPPPPPPPIDIPPPPPPPIDIPPPPPPPIDIPPPPAPPSSGLQSEVSSSKPPPAPSSGDARANLMEAIRQAGGSKKAGLRSAKEKRIAEKREKQLERDSAAGAPREKGPSHAAAGGDLMADLARKLTMRRKGISGELGNTSKSKSGSAVSGSSIPPPPPPLSSRRQPTPLEKLAQTIPSQSESEVGEDEEDTEGWDD
ncbi:unnamed protein product, partial [Cyprideis torosa]